MRGALWLLAALAGLCAAPSPAAAAVDFAKDIRPIFQDSCIKCHGREKQKGGLRLDSKAAALKGGKDGAVIRPSQAEGSDLYRRITLAPGHEDSMPGDGEPLTPAQTELIRDWINQGAAWPEGTVKEAVEEPSAVPGLPPYQPTAGELAAVAGLQTAGLSVRPIAANVAWSEANFRSRREKVTDDAMAPLKEIQSLIDLNLAGSGISDAGLRHIAGLTNLVKLHLEGTRITDAGLLELKTLSRLAYLNLNGTSVTDQGLPRLKGLVNLRRLYVWQTQVTAEGAADLQKALPQLQVSRVWAHESKAQSPAVAQPNAD